MFCIKMTCDDYTLISHSVPLEESKERIKAMVQQELQSYHRHDFKRVQNSTMIDAECRQKICEWSYRIVDHFRIDREIVLSSWYFIDRFLCSEVQICEPTMMRLLSMSALLLASKISGSRELTMSCMSSLSSNISVDVLTKMEVLLLRSLKWKVHPPTAKAVIRELMGLLAIKIDNYEVLKKVSEHAHFFAELSVFDSELASISVVEVAIASLLNALKLAGKSELSVVGESFFDDCRGMLKTQHVIGDIEFVQNLLWEVFLANEESAILRSNLTDTEPEAKRRRQDTRTCSPVSSMQYNP